MRIDFDRICKLAGVSSNSSRSLMREGKDSHGEKEANEYGSMTQEEKDADEAHGADHSAMEEEVDSDKDVDEMLGFGAYHEEKEEDDANELVDVNIAELMSEIRRAKKLMKVNETRKRLKQKNQQRLEENHLKRIIQKEVDNILSEIEEKDSSWIYGNRKPRYSKQGYTNQGRMIPGIGFGKKW